jgi:biotin carboxylase
VTIEGDGRGGWVREVEPARVGRLILLGPLPALIERSRALGLEVTLVMLKRDLAPADYDFVERVLVVSSWDDEQLMADLESLHAQAPFAACLTFLDSALGAAAVINDRLGCGWVSVETSRLIGDKAAMRARLSSRHEPLVEAQLCDTAQQAADFAERVGYPVVVKPRDGVASMGVRLAVDEAGLAEYFEPVRELLVEQYLIGPEYSIETFSRSGHHEVLAVVEKTLLPGTFVAQGHVAPAAITAETDKLLQQAVMGCLDAVGLADGPAHTEVVLTEDGPRIVETHDRVAGGLIWQLVSMTTGHDLLTMTLAWAAGMAVPPPWRPQGGPAAAGIRFLMPSPGRLTRIHGEQLITGRPGLVRLGFFVSPGDRMGPLQSAFDRAGYLIAQGADAASVDEICDVLARSIEFEYE